MDNKSDKDTIKEMLEGHKKKFNVVAVLIGIAVIVIIGLGAVYVIHTLNSTPKSYTEAKLNKYMENTKAQTESNNIQKENANVSTSQVSSTEENEQRKAQPAKENENMQQNQQNNQSPNPYPAVSPTVGNNTTISESNNINSQTTTSKNGVNRKMQSGPQIINPYAKNNKTQMKTLTANTKRIGSAKIKKHKKHYAKEKYIKHAKQYKRHKYTSKKQYVLQVSSNLDKKFVSLTLAKLKRCGYKAYIRIKIINNKVYRRVMVGPINGYTDAKDRALLIKRQLNLNYVPIIKKYDKVP